MKTVLSFNFTTLTDVNTGAKINLGYNSENDIYYISQDACLNYSSLIKVNKDFFAHFFLIDNLNITNSFTRELQATI